MNEFLPSFKKPFTPDPNFEYFETREEARMYCGAHGIRFLDMVKNPTAPKARRWAVPVKPQQQQKLAA